MRHPRPIPSSFHAWRRLLVSGEENFFVATLQGAQANPPAGPRVWPHALSRLALMAVRARKPTALRGLLQAGVPRGALDEVFLLAAHYGERDMMGMLANAGARVTAADPVTQNTALHWAASMGEWDLMQWLVRRGARWSARNAEGQTAWERFSSSRDADPETAQERGDTALLGLLRESTPPVAAAPARTRL